MSALLILNTEAELMRAAKEVDYQLQNQSMWYLLNYPPGYKSLISLRCFASVYFVFFLCGSNFTVLKSLFLPPPWKTNKHCLLLLYDAENVLLENSFNAPWTEYLHLWKSEKKVRFYFFVISAYCMLLILGTELTSNNNK